MLNPDHKQVPSSEASVLCVKTGVVSAAAKPTSTSTNVPRNKIKSQRGGRQTIIS